MLIAGFILYVNVEYYIETYSLVKVIGSILANSDINLVWFSIDLTFNTIYTYNTILFSIEETEWIIIIIDHRFKIN